MSSKENDILEDMVMAGFEEIKFKDLKVGMSILFTFQHGFEAGNGLVVRHGKVTEVNGYVIVSVAEADDGEVMLMPGCPVRAERYYYRPLKTE
jgi:hypothetical protein